MIKFTGKYRKFYNTTVCVLGLTVIFLLCSFVNRVIIKPPVDGNLDEGIEKNNVTEVIQVNILNASGKPGAAGKVMKYLRNMGFDVVEIGNYGKLIEKSCVLDRVGDTRSARKVAYALGISDEFVRSEKDSNLFLRSTVIIGNDFNGINSVR